MKKIIIGIVSVAACSVAYCVAAASANAAPAVNPHDHDCQGFRCHLCNGKGFQGNSPFPCPWCKGTGVNNSY